MSSTPVTDAVRHCLKQFGENHPWPCGNERALQDAIDRALRGFIPAMFREFPMEPPAKTAHRHGRPDFAVATADGAAIIEVKLKDARGGIRQLESYMESETTVAGFHATEAILFVGTASHEPRVSIRSQWAETGFAPLTIFDPFSLTL